MIPMAIISSANNAGTAVSSVFLLLLTSEFLAKAAQPGLWTKAAQPDLSAKAGSRVLRQKLHSWAGTSNPCTSLLSVNELVRLLDVDVRLRVAAPNLLLRFSHASAQ